MANDYHTPHVVKRDDPRVDGPYLDDIRAEQENAYREFRNVSAPVAEVEVEDDDTAEVLFPKDFE